MQLIGREKESKLLLKLINSNQAEFIAIYGRRRVGKTFLVQQLMPNEGVYLECTGLKDGKLADQLANFIDKFSNLFYLGITLEKPNSWKKAFELVTNEAKKIPEKKFIFFIDELPWLASPKSKLLQNLDYYWNSEWSKLDNFKLIVCGSAASWMLDNLINAKGGLYNRITRSILLEPFNLANTKKYLNYKNIKLTDKQVLDLYMVIGGIPFYLNHLDHTKSISQNINELCFKKEGLLFNEFTRLFNSLFQAAELNLQIVKEIAKHRYGISSRELTAKLGKKAGGRFAKRLQELEAAGFIQSCLPYPKKKRNHYYRIIDEYSLFYLDWISEIAEGKSVPKNIDYWSLISKTPAWTSWADYSFENVCFKHVDKIIEALDLQGTACLVSNWRYIPSSGKNENGAQIDLLIDRADNAITLCEIKYSSQFFLIDKSEGKNIMNKLDVFQRQSQTKKQIFVALITTEGLKKNLWSDELIHHQVILKDLF